MKTTSQRKASLLSFFNIIFSLLLMFFIQTNVVLAADRTEQININFLKAIENGDLNTAQAWLKDGADINFTNGGSTHAFELAIAWHRGSSATDVVQFLISRGANVNARFCLGWNNEVKNVTPLMCSMKSNYTRPEIIHLLVSNGADINAADSKGRNVLRYAVSYMKDVGWAGSQLTGRDIIKYLISKGADLNHKDYEGKTPFLVFIANLPSEGENVNSKYLPLVKYMIQMGADTNLSYLGKKPVDFALARKNIPVYRYLRDLENGTGMR